MLDDTTARLATFLRDTRGATAIEYALIAAGISVAIVVAVGSIGTSVKALFVNVRDSLT